MATSLVLAAVVALTPAIFTPLVASRLSEATGADVRVGWISWNPLRGRVVLHRIAIAPQRPDAVPAITLHSLVVDVALRRWLRGERRVDALVLSRPWVSLQRTAEGDFNVAALFPALARNAEAAAATASTAPPVPMRIGLLRMHGGSIEFRDETVSPVLETSLYLDDASARDIVLAGEHATGVSFHAESRLDDAPFTLDITYDASPGSSHLTATLVAKKASLARALLYVPLGWQRTSGTMDVRLTYERRHTAQALQQHGIGADVRIHDLALTEPWVDEPMLRAAEVHAPALAVDFISQRTNLGIVEVRKFSALVLRDDTRLHVPLASADPAVGSSPWQTTLEEIRLRKGTATLRNVFAVPEVTVPVASGTIRLPRDEIRFDFAGTLGGGAVTLAGAARGPTTTLSFALDGVGLAAAAPLIGVPVAFAKGRVDGSVDLRLETTMATFRGHVRATDASTLPAAPHPEEVIAWQALDATFAESTLDPLTIHLTEARLTWPYVMVHRRPDGIFPFAQKPVSAPDFATPPEPPLLRIDTLTVDGGRLEYYDTALPQPYGVDLANLEGSAGGLRLAPLAIDGFQLTGALDELSPVDVSGRIDRATATLRVLVDRLLLPPLNPYLVPALGYQVESGLARVASDVRLEGTKVTADTDLVLSRFAMRTAGSDPVGARIGTPLSVALALMKDTRGDITLDLPIEGDVGTSEYRVGNLLRDALGTALLGTLRAPLGFLRGIFRKDEGERFDLRPVPFPAGGHELTPESEARITEIARLLERQPALEVVLIPEPSEADLAWLRERDPSVPLEGLAALARERAAVVTARLSRDHGIDTARIRIEEWIPAEPRIQGAPGVDVQLRLN